MPEYAYRCGSCSTGFIRSLPMSMRNEPQPCPSCQSSETEKVVAGGVGTVLRGDGWVGKNIKVKEQMADRRERVGRREAELKRDGPQFKLAPNVGGERVDSWNEAAKLAASQGKDTALYDQRARQENQG